MSLLTKVYNGYTISQLMDMAVKLGLSVPETDDQFQALANDIQNKKEYQVVLEIENKFEAEDAELTETEKEIRRMADLLFTTRIGMQLQKRDKVIKDFAQTVVNKAIERLSENPFKKFITVIIDHNNFEEIDEIRSMLVSDGGSLKVSEKITKLVAGTGIKKIEIERYSYISINIEFEI